MKTMLKVSVLAACVTLAGGPALRAEINDMVVLAQYADQLADHGIGGDRFVELVDDRFWGLSPSVQQPGMGSYVQDLHARGLRGRALADAIHVEHLRRGDKVKLMPLPSGQKKEAAAPPMDRPER
ncbi:MAG: hypothetical protein ACO1TE_16360 [Prosthecobacter sp.]